MKTDELKMAKFLLKKIDDLKYYCELDCPLAWELTTEKTDDFTE